MITINYLTQIEFGFGAVSQLQKLALNNSINRPLIITDKGLVSLGVIENIKHALNDLVKVVIFDLTPSNPTESAALLALELYRDEGCDGLIAIGGGSSIDLAKAISILATHKGPLAQYAAIDGGGEKIGPVSPLIAIPTTSGTGSEVGRATLITLNDGRKLGLISQNLIPKAAICDPELTLSLPPYLTAATGLDAISHCIETYLSPRVNPVADAIALDGLVRAVGYIEKSVLNGNDRQSRWEMMMASLQGGLTFQKGLGAIHALSHPLGGLKNINLHHGTLNAIFLPAVLDFNKDCCKEKYRIIRERLNLDNDASLSNFFLNLNIRLGLPIKLRDIGVQDKDLEDISKAAILDHSNPTNPRKCTIEDYLGILKTVY
ncbi:4-hydroxybutyrate dehydrogenase [Marinomonas ushuaiensis DSM 15871]|uniref:4-hydroxybutyrate dehydrogenase n=1 Tax=Marinomonas ushuaiensis DSM 15871 TaxID=1122207 RepID=X7E2B9_9GAMM|nr:iron-containing alcohol dehydrogenase [Marinomonas ushuaiensis]ETX10219.1 4-hydroxybutyrate dehydrogenase [Marinomonas ushuaiensis DSM 15871]